VPDIISDQINATHAKRQFADDPTVIATAVENGCVSITKAEQLPESLRWDKDELPGLLFWHHPLGGGDPIPQFRPDKPADPDVKYRFPKKADGDASGTAISIVPSMQTRLDEDEAKSCRVLITEGTKQHLFAAAYAPDDVIVVGIQGCWGWSIGDAIASPALDGLCKGRNVVVALDADISTNQKVYDAAEALNLQLTTNQAKSVKFMKVPGSKTVGLDDYLSRRPQDNRLEPLATMISSATTFAKVKKPPRTRASALDTTGETFDFISVELGEVVEALYESIDDSGSVVKEHRFLTVAGKIGDRNVRRVSTLLRAAPTIVAAVEEKDDLTPGAEPTLSYDINLQIGPANACSNHLIRDVADKDLASVRQWIARAGTAGSFAALGRGGQGTNGQARIAEAMRDLANSSDTETRTTLLRTGWYQDGDTAYWVDSGGAHGPEGKITSIKAKLEGSVSSLDIPGYLENYTFDDVVASVKTMLEVCDYLYDPTPWIAGIVGTLWAVAGGSPDAVLYFVGGAGSGKSSVTGALASMLGSRWGTGADPMASIEGTAAYLADTTRQIHNCALILDDARDRSSSRSQENQDEALDGVIRVGYGGGGAARGKKVQAANGQYRQSAASFNRPFVVIAGETLPDSAPQSTIERCLVVEIKADTSLKAPKDTPDGRSGLDYLVAVSRSGALRPMLSYFLHAMAVTSTEDIRDENVPDVTSIDDVRLRIEGVRASLAEKALAKHWPKGVQASQRLRHVTATFLAGTSLFAEFIREFKIMEEADIVAFEDEWHSRIIAAAAAHSTMNLSAKSEAENIIAQVKAKVLGGRFCLGIPTGGMVCVGQEVTVKVDGNPVRAVALIPATVGEIIGNKHNLARRLAGVLIPDKNGSPTRVAGVNGSVMRCLVVRGDAWYLDDEAPTDVDSGTQDALSEDF
jgi:hypothetical protein